VGEAQNIETIVSPIAPCGIDVDPSDGAAYWTDPAHGTISRSDSDGANVETIISGLVSPADLAFAQVQNQIYWTDMSLGALFRSDRDGANIENLLLAIEEPFIVTDQTLNANFDLDSDVDDQDLLIQRFPIGMDLKGILFRCTYVSKDGSTCARNEGAPAHRTIWPMPVKKYKKCQTTVVSKE